MSQSKKHLRIVIAVAFFGKSYGSRMNVNREDPVVFSCFHIVVHTGTNLAALFETSTYRLFTEFVARFSDKTCANMKWFNTRKFIIN